MIYLYGADKLPNVKDKKLVKQIIQNIFAYEKTSLERINYIFCSDNYLLEINKQYLNHNFFTDVITFPLSKKGKPVYAEVYMSVDRIKENAKTYGVPYQNELLRIMFHGALHLCGYGDKTRVAKEQMRAKENHYLSQFHVSREANT